MAEIERRILRRVIESGEEVMEVAESSAVMGWLRSSDRVGEE